MNLWRAHLTFGRCTAAARHVCARKLPRRQAGFSLVEVMCAILILGIGLAGFIQGVTMALSSSKESELQTTAALIAAGQIETLRAQGYVDDGTTDGDCGEGLSLYRWTQTVTSTEQKGLHEVDVVVENTKSGKTIYELRTLLFDPPPSTTEDETTARKGSTKSKRKTGKAQ